MDLLITLLMIHTNFMDHILTSSKQLVFATKQNNMDLINFEVNNRERLINIIEELQFKIEERLNSFFTQESLEESTPIIKAWANDLGLWYEKIGKIDDEINYALERMKEETSKEIGIIYRSKESFKGYNLNTLK